MSKAARSANGLARWSLVLLGGFDLRALPGGQRLPLPGKRERALLAYLALSPSCRESRRKLTTLLWGDGADDTTLDNLRTCVWRLRKALDDTDHSIVVSQDDTIVLDIAALDIDALAFRRLLSQPERPQLEAATGLYAGEFLAGLDIESEEFESWRRAEATRFRHQAIEALGRLMTLLADCGETERAIESGLRLLALDPLHEEAVRRMMRLYSQTGRRGAAMQLYHSLAATLRAELDTEPEPETRLIFRELTRGGPDRAESSITPDAWPSRAEEMVRPDGASGERPKVLSRAPVRLRARQAIAAALVLSVALIAYLQLAPSGTRDASLAAQPVSTPAAGAISIAVLPFSNLSGDAGQEFLSDGMTEEITAALAKVPGLHVVARTSAYQFKGQNRDVQSIGQQLHASHVIEGSVRRAGDRLRITVQLIDAAGGTHLSSETYDRQFTDIFAVQEDIARAIATSLLVPLGLSPGENLVNRRLDPESYEQYLRAKQLVRARTAGAAEAIKILEPLLVRNPDFAPGWAQLAQAYGAFALSRSNASPEEADRIGAEYGVKRVAAATRAIESDPNSAEGYWAQAQALTQVQTIDELLSKALALDANNPDVLNAYGQMLLRVGRLKEALSTFQRLQALEPFVPIYTGNLGEALWLNGQTDAALSLLTSGPRGPTRAADIAMVYASMGRFGDAADTLLELPARNFPPELVADASRLLRKAPANAAEPQSLPRLASLGWIYLYVGAPMRALEFYEERTRTVALLWHPSYAPVRKTERFKAVVRKAGLIDYWRAKGWPELCQTTTGDDFTCE